VQDVQPGFSISQATETTPRFHYDDRLLYVQSVAKRLSIAPRTVRYLARSGRLPAFKIGKKIWRFQASAVEQYKARREHRNGD
jgi:excisionase family DNA binding protein